MNTLFAKPLTGGSEQPLGVTVTFWNYVPGAKGLYYMTPAMGSKAPYTFEVRLLDFTSRKSRTLHTLSLAGISPGLSVTPDGKTVVIEGVAEITQDMMRIENFR